MTFPSSGGSTTRCGTNWRPSSMASVEAPTEGAVAPNAADPAAPRRRARAPWFSPDNVVSMQVSRILFALVVLGAWQYGADRWFDSFFFSTPLKILVQVGHELIDPGFYNDLWVTGFEMGLGFAIGAGIALGVLLARWAYVAKVLDPFLLALYSIPRVALAPMLIVWFGIGYSSKIFLGATLVFFITFFNTISGIRSVDKGAVRRYPGDEGDRMAGVQQGDAAERIELDPHQRQDQPAIRARRRHPRRVSGVLARIGLSPQRLFDELQHHRRDGDRLPH